MVRLDAWRPHLRLRRKIALLAVLCAVAAIGTVAFAGEPSPVPNKSVSRADPAIKIEPRSFKELTPHERAASYNAAWLKVEPDRMVPAEKWRSPYCIEWDDNCTRCSRPDAASDPVCRAINASESVSCDPKIVQCSRVSDALDSVCAASQGVSGPQGDGHYYVTVCEAYWKDKSTGKYIDDCQDVGNIEDIYKSKSENIPGWPGYSRLPNGAFALAALEGIFPRGRSNLYCADPRRDSDGWVIDKLRPGF